ncbi:hypothetical protein ILUMI_02199, partial [Ignelater luminosus]
AGENLSFYVTASRKGTNLDGITEVFVNIINSTASKTKPFGVNSNRPFPFLTFNSGQPPPSIANNPPPFPGQHRYRPNKQDTSSGITNLSYNSSGSQHSLHLTPVKDDEDVDNYLNDQNQEVKSTTEVERSQQTNVNENNVLQPLDQAVRSVPDLTVALVPIVSVCGIFLAVGIIALVFRKKICLGRTKDSKEDMRKESSGGIDLQEDLAMHYWRGPRALGNRYVPWERDSSHPQATTQPSAPPKIGDRWEFPRHRLKVFNILGEGAFGQVWKCEALDIDGKEGVSIVAVKTLKENANEKEQQDLLSELQVMKMLEPHPNVVTLLGCCTEKDPIFVIMEFVSRGKLQSYLRNSRAERYYNNMHGQSKTLTSRDLTSFCYQVAKGMDFLSSNGIIHRDLAARNILITEDHTCKVADFGFARDVIDSHVYERKSEGRLPIRWMAPESLYDNIFSVKSDVWSFGVLIWEVVTLGSTPYTGLSAAEVMKKVRDGYRLEKPEHCRRELYNIMYYCWDKDSKQRPSFGECVELLEKLIVSETDYIELERFPDHSYYNMTSLSGEKL